MRSVQVKRKTKETEILLKLNLDGRGKYKIFTGISFMDHMLSLLSKHSLIDLEIKARGDLEVDIHHTNEDLGIVLGEALFKAFKKNHSLRRFGLGFAILDEAMARVVLDINRRPYLEVFPKNLRKKTKNYSFSYFKQFLRALVNSSRITLHLDILKGEDFHHILEVCFKALALALKEAVSIDKRVKGLPTTKAKL